MADGRGVAASRRWGAEPVGGPSPARRLLDWIDRRDWLFLPLPAAVFVALILGYPIYYTVSLGFHRWFLSSVKGPEWIGLGNYVEMAGDLRFGNAVLHTVYFVGIALAFQTVLGVSLALLFHRPFPGRGVARTLFLLPMVATPAAAALIWMMMFDPSVGILNYFGQRLGLGPIPWVADSRWVIPSLALVDTWHWTPLIMLIVLAALAALPAEPFEAARIDGAGAWQTFRYVTLPLIRPAIVVALIFRTIDALKTFDTIVVITGGGPNFASEILNIYAFNTLFVGFHFGYGSALLVVLGVLVFGITLVFTRIRRSQWYA